MGLESGVSVIGDLDPNWPLEGDGVHEGNDHIRNLKTAIQGSLPEGFDEVDTSLVNSILRYRSKFEAGRADLWSRFDIPSQTLTSSGGMQMDTSAGEDNLGLLSPSPGKTLDVNSLSIINVYANVFFDMDETDSDTPGEKVTLNLYDPALDLTIHPKGTFSGRGVTLVPSTLGPASGQFAFSVTWMHAKVSSSSGVELWPFTQRSDGNIVLAGVGVVFIEAVE